MYSPRAEPSSADVATELTNLSVGLGILMCALFPLTLPGLLLFVVAPLALVAIAGALLAIPLVLPLWLGRMLLRGTYSR